MGKKIEFSIIIPVYNVEKYIEKCLDSIINQHYDNIEIILVNDGSTDSSLKICQEYAEQYEFILLLNQKNQGLSAARNTGIKSSHGKYLIFLDSDDFLADKSLISIHDKIKMNTVDIVLGRASIFYEKNDEIQQSKINYATNLNKLEPYEVFEKLDNNNQFWFAAWMLIVNRKFIMDNSLFFMNGILHEDELWVPLVFLKANNMEVLNMDYYCYRIGRNGSIVNVNNIKREFDKLKIIDELQCGILGVNDKRARFIRARMSALVWGLIQNSLYYKDCSQIEELLSGINKMVYHLNYGKYKSIYLVLKVMGFRKFMRIIWCIQGLKT